MKFFNYNFLFVSSFTLEFGVAVLTAVFTILTLFVILVNASELSKLIILLMPTKNPENDGFIYISRNKIVLVSIALILFTWVIALAGALSRSRTLIALTIVIWAIFIIEWLVLSLYFRVLKHDISYCVGQKTRCATTMWLMDGGTASSASSDDSDESKTKNDTETESETDSSRRLWSINYSPEITVKTFHPMRTNVIPNTVTATPAANTVVSNQTSKAVGVNNGCGCEHHPRTTTESPPSDLITRVIEYRKNMTMYRQISEAVIQRKKKDGEKNKVSDEEYDRDNDIGREHHKKKGRRRKTDADDSEDEVNDNDHGEGDSDDTSKDDETEEKGDKPGNTADSQLIDLVAMACFLLLYVYTLYVLLSYHKELKLMQNCKCTYLT